MRDTFKNRKKICMYLSVAKENVLLKYAFALFLFFIATYLLFYGSYADGMEMDEVNRKNNLIPFLNPNAEPLDQSIFSITAFDYTIPLIYREYISTACLVPYIPLGLFDDYLYGLRTLYMLYFFISISAFFLILSRFIPYTHALAATLLVLTNPILFPEVRIGFAHSYHLLFLSIGLYLLYIFFNSRKNSLLLFLGVFLLFAYANIHFYFMWVISSLFITSLIFFRDYWRVLISSPKYVIIAITAAATGTINFVIYNIGTNFATIKPLIQKIFFLQEYKENPVGPSAVLPINEELAKKAAVISHFYGMYGEIFFIAALILLTVVIFLTYNACRRGQFGEYKLYLFPIATFTIILALILLTPETYRPGHYAYLIPFIELSIISIILWLQKSYKTRISTMVCIGIIVTLLAANVYVTASEVQDIQIGKSRSYYNIGYFSPAIYQLDEYLHKNHINSSDVVFLQWGLSAQMYFLNKGEFCLNEIGLNLIDTNNAKDQREMIAKIFLLIDSDRNSEFGDGRLYFPVYNSSYLQGNAKFKWLNDKSLTSFEWFESFVQDHNGEWECIQTFYEKNGDPVIDVYVLSNPETVINNIWDELINSTTPIDTQQLVKSNNKPCYSFILQVDGEMKSTDQIIEIDRETSIIYLDGWAVDWQANTTAQAMQLTINKDTIVPVVYHLQRADVANYFNNPSFQDSGFFAFIPASSLTAGRNKIYVQIITADGKQYYEDYTGIEILVHNRSVEETSFDISNLTIIDEKPIYGIDTVVTEDKQYHSLTDPIVVDNTDEYVEVHGFALDPLGNSTGSKVVLSLNGEKHIRTIYFREREDVADYFNNPNFLSSGFYAYIPTSYLKEGCNNISITIISKSNQRYYADQCMVIEKKGEGKIW